MIHPSFQPSGMVAPLLGEILVEQLHVPADAIERGLAKQREEGGLIGEVLVRLKLIDEDQLAYALAIQAEMPWLKDLPRAEEIPAELIELLPINFAKQNAVLPLGLSGDGRVQVAIADPTALDVVDHVAVLLGGAVDPVVAAPTRRSRTARRTSTSSPARGTSSSATGSTACCARPSARPRSSRPRSCRA
jgi:hypothetical protein